MQLRPTAVYCRPFNLTIDFILQQAPAGPKLGKSMALLEEIAPAGQHYFFRSLNSLPQLPFISLNNYLAAIPT
jgi:hypothetical protein